MNRAQSVVSASVGGILAIIVLLQSFGISVPVVDATQLSAAITGIITVAVWVFQIWKNHNFTDAALKSQEFLNDLKRDQLIDEDIAENAKHLK